jgi:two-component system, LytTR family, response regulator
MQLTTPSSEKPPLTKTILHPDDKSINQWLFLPDHQDKVRLLIKDIVFLEGVRNYTLFHLRDGRRVISTRTLKKYEEELAVNGFHRIHKSYVINMHHLTLYDNENASYVVLRNDIKVMVARRKRKDFEGVMKSFLFG